MWLVNVYSQGDIMNDDYLQVNYHVHRDYETGEYFDTYEDRFTCSEDVIDRVDFILACIDRLVYEKDFLLKYSDKLVRLGSYSNLKEGEI